MQGQIQNKTLFLVKKLLQMVTDKTVDISPNGEMWVGEDVIADLSPEELRSCLKVLIRRGVIDLGLEDHLDDLSSPLGADVITDQARIREFCRVADNILSGIDMNNREQVGNILGALHVLTRSKIDKDNKVKLSGFGFRRIDTLEWIADYSAIIEVIYEPEVDVDYRDGRTWVMGASDIPKAVRVLNKPGLGALYQQIRDRVGLSYQRQVNALLRAKKRVEWRCAKCGRAFGDAMASQKQIVDYLIDFTMFRFKACHNCREKNYFSISPKGKIDFLIEPKDQRRPRKKVQNLYEYLRQSSQIKRHTEKE